MFQRIRNVTFEAYVLVDAFARRCENSRGRSHCVKAAINYVLEFSVRVIDAYYGIFWYFRIYKYTQSAVLSSCLLYTSRCV